MAAVVVDLAVVKSSSRFMPVHKIFSPAHVHIYLTITFFKRTKPRKAAGHGVTVITTLSEAHICAASLNSPTTLLRRCHYPELPGEKTEAKPGEET